MNCSSCGFQLAADDVFCLSCGAGIAAENGNRNTGWPVQEQSPDSSSCHCGAPATAIGNDGVCGICGSMLCKRDDMLIERNHGLVLYSHVGKTHSTNEDFGLVDYELVNGICYRWVMVSDGVSCSVNSELASELACRAASESLRESIQQGVCSLKAIESAIWSAQNSVLAVPYPQSKCSGRKREPPEATIAIALLDDENATIGWVGDSRIYSVVSSSAGLNANLLTRDHSYANAMVDLGHMTLEEAMRSPDCNAITQSLGVIPEGDKLEPGLRQLPLQGAICLLACSDGLWNYVHPVHNEPAGKLVQLIAATRRDPSLMAKRLIDHANLCGGRDNITVAIAMLEGDEHD